MVSISVTKVVTKEEEEAPIHGDILEAILTHVPLIHLAPASHVSRSWSRAVASSLGCFNRLKPWLIVHSQDTRSPHATATRCYDPRSRVWVEIGRSSPVSYVSALRSSGSNLAYMLSPSKLSFSFDPLHLTWHHADVPLVWRTDPIVALVSGSRVVVAGGTCDFEDDPLAVEIYDVDTGDWTTCKSMPSALKDTAASTWLSIASDDRRMFVTERYSGATYTFDPATMTWQGPYDLRPEPSIFYSVTAFAGDRLILIGLIGDAENVKSMKLWEVNSGTFGCEPIGEAPITLVKKLKSQSTQITAISVCSAANTMYVYNPSEVEEVLMCEFVDGGCRWGSVRNAGGRNCNGRLAISCSEVGIDDVCGALKLENLMKEEL